jgi:hypothetical protein
MVQNDKLTTMDVQTQEDGILITFPQVKENTDPLPDMSLSTAGIPLEYREMMAESIAKYGGIQALNQKSEQTSLYLTHRAEPTDLLPEQTVSNSEAYSIFHPEELSLYAFQSHRGYALTPQDIGAQLLLDFGEYVHNNQERCANIFNGTVGQKKEITVWLQPGESLKTLEVLAKAMKGWHDEVRANTDSNIRDVLHPDFSQKNPIVDLAYQGLLMGAAKDFFAFGFSTACGIPRIKVGGTKNDWEQIGAMVAGLGSVKELSELTAFYQWANEQVIQNILSLYDGKEDLHFWKSIVKYRSMSGSEGSSAGWLPSLNIYGENKQLLPMDMRWHYNKEAYQVGHKKVPVVNVTLVSDNTQGIGNIDPTLSVNIGFTSRSYNTGLLKPVLGLDAYVSQHEKTGSPED